VREKLGGYDVGFVGSDRKFVDRKVGVCGQKHSGNSDSLYFESVVSEREPFRKDYDSFDDAEN
jgi:hypothetical protein